MGLGLLTALLLRRLLGFDLPKSKTCQRSSEWGVGGGGGQRGGEQGFTKKSRMVGG